jgi:hypothetical protein
MESIYEMTILMILVSYIIMSNVMLYIASLLYNNIVKVYMALLMGALMVLISYGLMLFRMYTKNNLYIFGASIAVTVFLIFLIRKQILVDDDQFLRSMIEHHSAALLMTDEILKKTNNKDIKNLAENIYNSQTKEISLMQKLLNPDESIQQNE